MELEKTRQKEYPLSIKNWPEEDRPREKLFQYGVENLTESELLAIILNSGIKGKSALDLARDILNAAGGLKGLENLEPTILRRKGIGQAKLARILAALELGRRINRNCQQKNIAGKKIKSSQDVLDYLKAKLSPLPRECLLVLLLNTRNVILREILLSQGTINRALIDPADVIREALREYATGLILVHNHPSGEPAPSPDDIEMTGRVVQAARLFEIRVLDHIIVGRSGSMSFFDQGLLNY